MNKSVKAFQTYQQQLQLLSSRGMEIDFPDAALEKLTNINYYRLSGYWYPFREQIANASTHRLDNFYPGTTFEDVIHLYDFDERLRSAVFACLTPIELSLRALLGHYLGEVHECAHMKPDSLFLKDPNASKSYQKWISDYNKALSSSKEDFVLHHQDKYGGNLPIWVAVEILDWGKLSYLFVFSPLKVQQNVADSFGLTAPQLHSWMKSLNILRNICAHHGRLFNRGLSMKPRLPKDPAILGIPNPDEAMNRAFGQLTLIQYLLHRRNIGDSDLLPTVLESFPSVRIVPISHIGAPDDWRTFELWK